MKFNNNTRLLVRKVIDKFEEDGKIFIKTQWFEQKEQLNLGSLKNPKGKDIIEIRYEEIPKNIFGGLFK